MDELSTIRERVQRATAHFHRREAVVLTTFNLNGAFLEDQALPCVLGVDAKTTAARRAETHQQLGQTPCTIFYDPGVPPKLSGRYRFVARPVPMRGRFFHPKLIIIAGQDEGGATWVYLAVSSANLTLSGWGRNAECFGETWIYVQHQQAWGALDSFLEWLQNHAPLGEVSGRDDAVARVRAALARMPRRKRLDDDGHQIWSNACDAQLYTSVTHPEGLAHFLQMGRRRPAQYLWVYSPYWGEVAEQVAAFNATNTTLLPALRADGQGFGLSQAQAESLTDAVELYQNGEEAGMRFWHMKVYWIYHGKNASYTAVGSSNFTHAGLAGEGGNVEASLVYPDDGDWLPYDDEVELSELAEVPLPEEEAPTPPPIMIVVAYDWRARAWRWWLEPGARQRDFKLELPGIAPFQIKSGAQKMPGEPPPRGGAFTVSYQSAGEPQAWRGLIVELNLDHSARTYGRALTASEILESWRGATPSWEMGGGGERGEEGEAGEAEGSGQEPAAFDAVNLYDLYRAMRALRVKLRALKDQPEAQHALIVGRPDSALALAHLARREGEAPTVRYLVLREISSVLSAHAAQLDEALVTQVAEMAAAARTRTQALLSKELGTHAKQANHMLGWVEARLAAMDGDAS